MLRFRPPKRALTLLSLLLMLLTLTFGSTLALAAHAAGNFTTQTVLGLTGGDNWEPAVTTDHYGHVYVLYKDVSDVGGTLCSSCPEHVVLQISNDNGKTWGAAKAIDPEPVTGGQYDPQIVVDPADGKTVWASFLQNGKSSIAVMKSTDFGQTWTGPTIVENLQRATDKDELTVRGNTIAVGYNAVQKIYASVSHDGGQTWNTYLVNSGGTQQGWSLGGGAGIDSQGNIYFAWDGYTQNGQSKGPVNLYVTKSSDGGQTWNITDLDVSGSPYPCSGCTYAFLGAGISLSIGSDDSIYVLYNSTADQTNAAPERIFFRKSTDHGATYSARQDVSSAPQGIEHSFPAVATGSTSGDVRIGWMDMRSGAWNLFYRTSTNGGSTWSSETQISSYVPGYYYLSSNGYQMPYGDYFQMSVDNTGSTQIAWGEGSAAGPGNIWTSHN